MYNILILLRRWLRWLRWLISEFNRKKRAISPAIAGHIIFLYIEKKRPFNHLNHPNHRKDCSEKSAIQNIKKRGSINIDEYINRNYRRKSAESD
jgi:hypothetical protein